MDDITDKNYEKKLRLLLVKQALLDVCEQIQSLESSVRYKFEDELEETLNTAQQAINSELEREELKGISVDLTTERAREIYKAEMELLCQNLPIS